MSVEALARRELCPANALIAWAKTPASRGYAATLALNSSSARPSAAASRPWPPSRSSCSSRSCLEPAQPLHRRGHRGSAWAAGGGRLGRRRGVLLGRQGNVDPQLARPRLVDDWLAVLGDDHLAEDVLVRPGRGRRVHLERERDLLGVLGQLQFRGRHLRRQADESGCASPANGLVAAGLTNICVSLPCSTAPRSMFRLSTAGRSRCRESGGHPDRPAGDGRVPHHRVLPLPHRGPAVRVERNSTSFCPSGMTTDEAHRRPAGCCRSFRFREPRRAAFDEMRHFFERQFDPARNRLALSAFSSFVPLRRQRARLRRPRVQGRPASTQHHDRRNRHPSN